MTLCKDDEELYYLIRKWINGGLSNVHNRYNTKGQSTIKKLEIDEERPKGELSETNDKIKKFDTNIL
jgi:hypothetical protein